MPARTLAWLLTTTLVAGVLVVPPAQAADASLRYGMSMGSVDALTTLGAKPAFGMTWAGAWIQTSGWGGIDNDLTKAYSTGVTPVIQFWYWGDSISPTCVENDCYDSLHGQTLSKASWYSMASTLASHIQSKMGGREVIVIVESEFNKNGIDSSSYAPTFDGYLDQQMATLHKVAGVKTVVGFGNWGQSNWGRFPNAIAASDLLGFQTMRGSTRDSLDSYTHAIDAVKTATDHLHATFNKPTILYDLALSSYPEPDYLGYQDAEIKELFARAAELQTAGLTGVVYRSLTDNPNMDTANYYGTAERYWGLRHADGTAKPALQTWLNGVQATSTTTTTTPTFSAPVLNATLGLEAESFETKTTGGLVTQSTASGGGAWNLWSNGEIRQRVNVTTSASYVVTIRARGELSGSQLPHMVLKLDGVQVAAWDVGSTSYADHNATITLPSGEHTLAIAFTNDEYTSTGDRNLVADMLRIATNTESSPTPVPAPAPAAITLSASAYKVRGDQRVDLVWAGATSTSVDVWRDGVRIATTPNDGSHTDVINKKGGGAYTYRLCEAVTSTCSADVRVSF